MRKIIIAAVTVASALAGAAQADKQEAEGPRRADFAIQPVVGPQAQRDPGRAQQGVDGEQAGEDLADPAAAFRRAGDEQAASSRGAGGEAGDDPRADLAGSAGL